LSVIKIMFSNLIMQDPFVSYHIMLVLFISLGEGNEGGMGFAQSAFFSFGFLLFLQEATLIGSSEKNSWRCQ
jgi:hypothetical protein